jgi:hypothetical protein
MFPINIKDTIVTITNNFEKIYVLKYFRGIYLIIIYVRM